MPVPCREQIIAAALARLEAIGGVTAERNRRTALSEDDLAQPRLILFEGPDSDITQYSMEDAFEFALRIQGAVKGSGAAAATALNTLRAQVMQALRPPGDFTPGRSRPLSDDQRHWRGRDRRRRCAGVRRLRARGRRAIRDCRGRSVRVCLMPLPSRPACSPP
jgi:hypothetical protein